MTSEQALSKKQEAIAPIAAFAAAGDMRPLDAALNQGLDAGLSVSDAKEILVQLYAYAGFPRSLNALGELMKVLDARKQRGIEDAAGRNPGPAPTGEKLLEVGTANQTKLSGGPVKGKLFEFAPAIDEFLKTHLSATSSRATTSLAKPRVGYGGGAAAMSGVESQLQAHIQISMNVGLSAVQLRQVAQVLTDHGLTAAGGRVEEALNKQLAATAK